MSICVTLRMFKMVCMPIKLGMHMYICNICQLLKPVWFLKYKVLQTEFFAISGHFLPFHPTDNPKKENFEKLKTIPGDIIICTMCTINDNHVMYGS